MSRSLLPSLIVLLSCTVLLADDWTRFRGPNGTGVSTLKGLPTQWTEQDYDWTVTFKGIGHSSPVVWGERLFVTSSNDTEDGSRVLHCLDANTGTEHWSRTTQLGTHNLHKKNSYASGTPAVDAERVYVAFADAEHFMLSAHTHAGEEAWTIDLGPYASQHGLGTSPIVHGDWVIIAKDQDGPSNVVAVDRKTGQQAWELPRPNREVSYSTPVIIEREGKSILICLSGAGGLSGFDLATRTLLWETGEVPKRTVGSPVLAGDQIFASCGQGGRGVVFWGVNLKHDPKSADFMSFKRETGIPYVPTPVVNVAEQLMFLWNDDGIVYAVDLKTQENVWQKRIGGNYSASPLIIDGKLYALSEDGEVAVVDATRAGTEYGKSPLGDRAYATPSVANGRLYLRGFHKLAALKAK